MEFFKNTFITKFCHARVACFVLESNDVRSESDYKFWQSSLAKYIISHFKLIFDNFTMQSEKWCEISSYKRFVWKQFSCLLRQTCPNYKKVTKFKYVMFKCISFIPIPFIQFRLTMGRFVLHWLVNLWKLVQWNKNDTEIIVNNCMRNMK